MANVAEIQGKFSALYELAKRFNNAELNLEISNLKMEMSRLMDENTALKDRVQELTEDKEHPLKYVDWFYINDKGELFCPGCYDKERKRIHLKQETGNGHNDLSCPVCKTPYHQGISPETLEELRGIFGKEGKSG
jgi:hypothetical protein